MAENLVIVKKDRGVIRTSVNKFIKEIKDVLESQDPDLLQLEETLEQLNEASIELKKLDSDIKKLIKEDKQLDAELQSAEEFREKIISWRFKANRKIKEINKKLEKPSAVVKQDDSASKNETISVKLPKLEITKFSGNCSEWLTFWSSFQSAIHDNKNLDPVDKFNYLKTYLSGFALKSVEGFAITSDNYFKCIDLLTQRFGKTEVLINEHMNNLLSIPPVKYSSDIRSLRALYDVVQIQIRSLESLKVDLTSYSNLLTPIILKLLPRDLILEFHKENINKTYSVNEILNFLFIQLNARERMRDFPPQTGNQIDAQQSKNFDRQQSKAGGNMRNEYQNKNKKFSPSALQLFCGVSKVEKTNKQETCSFCDAAHSSNSCTKIKNWPFHEKLNILRKRNICFRCLKRGVRHVGKECQSDVFCTCGLPHAEIMCNRKKEIKETEIASSNFSKQMLSNRNKLSSVYLQTLIAEVKGNNKSALVRVIIDTGSENSYLSKYLANNLNLKKVKTETIKHGLFSGIEMSEEHTRYKFRLSSLDKCFSFEIEALDQNKICTGIKHINDKELINALQTENVFLSDVYENREICLFENDPQEIHLLLGADIAAHLFTQNVRYLPKLGLSAFQTKLGWVVMGKTKGNRENSNTKDSISTLSLSLHVSNSNLSDLWRLDTLGISNDDDKGKGMLEEETRKHFLESVKRDDTGRYEVALPWVIDNSVLPNGRFLAEKSLFKTENKLIKVNKRQDYEEIFDCWEDNNIIEVVTEEKKEGVHYLPHRPVIKESSETTKIRPVFNASAHTRNSPSLNDCLAKGPNLIEIIPSILNRFRKYRIGVSSDIEKAFCQIQIQEKDRDFLRFLWFDEENNIKIYRHNRVVFGLTSSPFLLAASLDHLLNTVHENFLETSQILKDSFYIDNSLVSLIQVQQAEKFITESKAILASGCFNLRCWRTNMQTLVIDEVTEDQPKVVPVLGLVWDLEKDSLSCKIEETHEIKEPITKRKILSATQKIFDPIGFTAPTTLIPKLILQETWIQKIKWDEDLPTLLSQQFKRWLDQLPMLAHIEIPRWLNIDDKNEKTLTLHIFSDASKRAYATCVYIRVEAEEGPRIQLVSARSRVAPIKELSIPRLELLACLIGARLAKTVMTDLKLKNCTTVYWTDSTTALGWIRRDVSWGTFVHNRVQEIRKLTKIDEWRHVPGSINPADLPSRGCSFEQLLKSKWWEGPSWLYLPENEWPQTDEEPDEELINRERRKTVLSLLDKIDNTDDWYYKYFSSYRKLVRMFAWIHRFLDNLKNTEKNLSPNISVEELERAEKTIIKLIQKESFTGQADPKIKSLRPLEDENEILRVKTNVIYRNDSENFRYPVILPNHHPVVERLIFEKHVENQHAGVGVLMSILRENYWIIKSRKCIRQMLRKCIKCKRFDTNRIDVEPGIPPEDRVRDAAIFEVVGTDLAGPLFLSDGTKAWIVLFTCAIYRAIHLELISSLSTDSFLQSLRRFIARRGRPYVIYSDNGKNYVGTANALSSINWDQISTEASIKKIRWKFNPPAAPWWGGWWERLVRLVKENLRKVLGRASLNYEELNTVLCDCEQVINSRPITYVSEDNKDLTPLTPKMFLQELPSSGTPDLDALDAKSLTRRVKYRQRVRDELRKRFRNEYLGQLRQHSKKKDQLQRLSEGDLVLLEDTNGKRINWPLAKIVQLLPGKDGINRLARVETKNGTFLRPVQRLFPLEVCLSSAEGVHPAFQTTEINRAPPKDNFPQGEPTHPVVTRSGRVVKSPRRFPP